MSHGAAQYIFTFMLLLVVLASSDVDDVVPEQVQGIGKHTWTTPVLALTADDMQKAPEVFNDTAYPGQHGQKVGPHGHLYLGAGRRRAGAGFYKPLKMPKQTTAQKKEASKVVMNLMHPNSSRRRSPTLARSLENQLNTEMHSHGQAAKERSNALPPLKDYLHLFRGKNKGKRKGKSANKNPVFTFFKDLVKITSKPRGKRHGKANPLKARTAKINKERADKERAAKMESLEDVSNRHILASKLEAAAKKKGKRMARAEKRQKMKGKLHGKKETSYKERYQKDATDVAELNSAAAKKNASKEVQRKAKGVPLLLKREAADLKKEKREASQQAKAIKEANMISEAEPKLVCSAGRLKCTNKCADRYTEAGCVKFCKIGGTCDHPDTYGWCKQLCQGTCKVFCPGPCVSTLADCPA